MDWREQEMQGRKERVLEAALKLFAREGYDGVTMDQLASASGFSRKSLYNYFGSKEEVVLELFLRSNDAVLERFEKQVGKDIPGGLILRKIGEDFFRFSQEEPDLFIMESIDLPADTDLRRYPAGQKLLENKEKMGNLMMGVIQKGQKDGSIRGDLNPMLTAIFVGLVSTQMILFLASPRNQALEHYGIEMKDFYEFTLEMIGRAITPDEVWKAQEEENNNCKE